MESFPLDNIFTNASWPLLWPSWLSQDLASKTRLLLEHSLATVSDVPYCCSADQKQKQQAFVCSRSEYPCSVFHVYKKLFFLVVFFFFFWGSGFNNGSFLARHAVSRQSTLLGPTAGCAVLIINFADECRLRSPLIYFSLANVPMYIPAGASLCCCCCHIYACM